MPKPSGMSRMPGMNIGGQQGQDQLINLLSQPGYREPIGGLSQPGFMQQTNPSQNVGVSSVSNPNNNFISSALKGPDNPGINPNANPQITTPITNTPQTNMQDIASFSNIQKMAPSMINRKPTYYG